MRSAAQAASAMEANVKPATIQRRDEGDVRTGSMRVLRIRSAARPAWRAMAAALACVSLEALRRRLSPGLPLSRPSGPRDPADVSCEVGPTAATTVTAAATASCGNGDCDDCDCARRDVAPDSPCRRMDIYSVTLDRM